MIVTIITHSCPKCGSTDMVKNGHDYKGAQKYHCKTCRAYGTLDAQVGHSEAEKAQVRRAVLERLSLRALERVFGLSRRTVARWLVHWATALPDLAHTLVDARLDDVLELDELWSFVLKKTHQRWLWVALCRRTRQVVAYFIGDRSQASCLQLWRRIPQAYVRCHTFSDFWDAYQGVFDPQRHPRRRQSQWADRSPRTLVQYLAPTSRSLCPQDPVLLQVRPVP